MAGMAVETVGNREMIKLLLKPDNMRHLFLLTLLLSFLGACTPKPVESSFVHVNKKNPPAANKFRKGQSMKR